MPPQLRRTDPVLATIDQVLDDDERLRAGIEGRISVCKRRGWIGRCRDHGEEGFERWIGWGVIANNLVALARHEAKQSQERAA